MFFIFYNDNLKLYFFLVFYEGWDVEYDVYDVFGIWDGVS